MPNIMQLEPNILSHGPTPPPLPTQQLTEESAAKPPPIRLEPRSAAMLGAFPVPWRHPIRCVIWLVRAAFGTASLVFLLAVIAAIPGVNFVALGYMMEAQGRVARTGRIRDAMPLFRLAPRVGSIALGIFLWTIPLQILASRVADAAVIDPTGQAARSLGIFKMVSSVLIAVHLCLALARGGTLGTFFRPLKNILWFRKRLKDGTYWEDAHYHVMDFVSELQLGHHFVLGLKGVIAGLAWLAIPTAMLAFYTPPDRVSGGATFVSLLGGLLLVPVFAWLPFLQCQLASEGRLRAAFELRAIRKAFRRSPLTWLFGVLLLYVLAVPLYVTKVRLLPQDAMWLITGVFIVSMYPARILVGWVYHRAVMRPKEAWFGFRWLSRLSMVPLLGVYVFLVYLSQAIGEHGKAGLFENHAFLLPVPF